MDVCGLGPCSGPALGGQSRLEKSPCSRKSGQKSSGAFLRAYVCVGSSGLGYIPRPEFARCMDNHRRYGAGKARTEDF